MVTGEPAESVEMEIMHGIFQNLTGQFPAQVQLVAHRNRRMVISLFIRPPVRIILNGENIASVRFAYDKATDEY